MKCDKKICCFMASPTGAGWGSGPFILRWNSPSWGRDHGAAAGKGSGEGGIQKEARQIQELCKKHQVPFLINDNVELAVEIEADGVHVGQHDMEAGQVRQKIGPDKILGSRLRRWSRLSRAQAAGADYLGVGAVFPTGTKDDADAVSLDTLKAICQAVDIPVVAIGGIKESNILSLKGSGICGVAVVSAIYAKEDPQAAAAGLRKLTEEAIQ